MKCKIEKGAKTLKRERGEPRLGTGSCRKRSKFAATKCASFIFCQRFNFSDHFEFGENLLSESLFKS